MQEGHMEFVANCQKGGVMSIRDYNSENNQVIKEEFVDKEVFGSVSSLMERIVKCENISLLLMVYSKYFKVVKFTV